MAKVVRFAGGGVVLEYGAEPGGAPVVQDTKAIAGLGAGYFTVQIVAAKVAAALATGDAGSAIIELAPFELDERLEILNAAAALGADPQALAEIATAISGEVINVTGKAPVNWIPWAAGGAALVLGLLAYRKWG